MGDADVSPARGRRPRFGPSRSLVPGRVPGRHGDQPKVRACHPRGPRPARHSRQDTRRPRAGPKGAVTPSPAVTAIVLAGGRSSRFGSPKLEANVDGMTLLERAIRAVAAVAGEIIVAGTGGPDPGSVAAAPARTRADPERFAGPP